MVKKILSQLTNWLQSDSRLSTKKDKKSVNVQEALKIALSIKCQSDSERTRQTFTHQAKMFTFFIVTQKLHMMKIEDFTKLHAVAYLDHVSESRSLNNRSYNNYLNQIKSLFGELVNREIIETNPFSKVPLKAQKLTSRRPFTKEESVLIADYIREHSPVLFIAIILEHYCLIRPAELRRMKLGAIDFSKSVIRISEDVAKMNVSRTVTIPLAIWQYLKPYSQYPANYFLFGENLKPHPSKMCGEKTLATKHRTVLKDLQKKGLLNEIDTICLYSWKYLGIKEYAELFGILASKEQAGHKTMEMTLRYYRGNEVNKDILNLKISDKPNFSNEV
jgi:integrase